MNIRYRIFMPLAFVGIGLALLTGVNAWLLLVVLAIVLDLRHCVPSGRMRWDGWESTADGSPVFMYAKLLPLPRGWQVRLNWIIGIDATLAFHSHDRHIWRLILGPGYYEEVACKVIPGLPEHCYVPIDIHKRGRFYFDHIKPRTVHRIGALVQRTSLSLVVMGPVCDTVKLLGAGWATR